MGFCKVRLRLSIIDHSDIIHGFYVLQSIVWSSHSTPKNPPSHNVQNKHYKFIYPYLTRLFSLCLHNSRGRRWRRWRGSNGIEKKREIQEVKNMSTTKTTTTTTTTTQCRKFVQNAWKKELCSNCFKPKEEHVVALSEPITRIVGKSVGVRRVALKVQVIDDFYCASGNDLVRAVGL